MLSNTRTVLSLLYLSTFLAVLGADIDSDNEYKTKDQKKAPDLAKGYHFKYEINDNGGYHHRDEKSDGKGTVRGSYGYHDAQGVHRHVTYIADKHGFRAQVITNEPGTDNQNPADVHMHMTTN